MGSAVRGATGETINNNFDPVSYTHLVEEIEEMEYDTKEHDWITEQEMGSSIMKETENLWTPVKRFLNKHKKPKWGDWDGLHIEEEEL